MGKLMVKYTTGFIVDLLDIVAFIALFDPVGTVVDLDKTAAAALVGYSVETV